MKINYQSAALISALLTMTSQAHPGAHLPDTSKPQVSTWDQIAQETLLPGLKRQFIFGEKSMLVRFEFEKGSTVPMHSHPNEQITFVEKGDMVFTVSLESSSTPSRSRLQ